LALDLVVVVVCPPFFYSYFLFLHWCERTNGVIQFGFVVLGVIWCRKYGLYLAFTHSIVTEEGLSILISNETMN